MKKWARISLSILATSTTIPTIAVLSSCSKQITLSSNYSLYSCTYEQLQQFIGNLDLNEFKQQLNQQNQELLRRMCIPLFISIGQSEEIKFESISESNNTLYIKILVGINVNDANNPNIRSYNVEILNIDPNLNNNFPNKIYPNQIISEDKFNQEAPVTLSMQTIDPTIDSIIDSKVKLPLDYLWLSNSSNVLNKIDTIIKNKKYNESNNFEIFLKKDIQYFIKNILIQNFIKQNLSVVDLIKFNIFSSVKIFPNQENQNNMDGEFCFQFQNNTYKVLTFSFFDQIYTINPKEYLTCNVSFLNLSTINLFCVGLDNYIGLLIKNCDIQMQVAQVVSRMDNKDILIGKSYTINTVLQNVFNSNQNPYNMELAKEIENNLLNANIDIKRNVENRIEKDFAYKKSLALANLELIEKFSLPSIKTNEQLQLFDVDNNGIFSLYDLLTTLGEPLSKFFLINGNNNAAVVIKNLFSNLPMYEAFYNSFDELINLLKGLNNEVVSEVIFFIQQNLSVDGIKKPLNSFKEFFSQINNLKEVLRPILVNSSFITPYTAELIYQILDSLSDTNQNLFQWLSNNFIKILTIIESLLDNGYIKNLISNLKNIQFTYNNRLVNNIVTDIPLYNLFSGESVNVTNPVDLTNLQPIFNLLINQLLKDNSVVSSLTTLITNSIINLIANKKIGTIDGFKSIFRDFFIPKTINNQPNTNSTTIYDLLNMDSSYKIINQIWSEPNNSNSIQFTNKYSFQVQFPSFTISVSKKITDPSTKQDVNITNLNYEYYFSNSSLNPIIFKDDEISKLGWQIPVLVNTIGLLDSLGLEKQNFMYSNLKSNEYLNVNSLNIDNYYSNVASTEYKIRIQNKDTISLSLNDVLQENNQGIKFLTESGYNKIIEFLNNIFNINKINNNSIINFNSITIRPFAYIKNNQIEIKFPISIITEKKNLLTTIKFGNELNIKCSIS